MTAPPTREPGLSQRWRERWRQHCATTETLQCADELDARDAERLRALEQGVKALAPLDAPGDNVDREAVLKLIGDILR